MLQKPSNSSILKLLILLGIFIAIGSALESRVEWLASFCGRFGDGCRETEHFTLFLIPVPMWGILFYLLAGAFLFFLRSWVFWSVMVGVGVELSFIRTMFSLKLVCIFCLLNLLVMGLLFYFTIDKRRIWQALTIILFSLMVSNAFLTGENQPALSSENGGEETVVAKVGDFEITQKDLEMPLAGWLYKSNMRIYEEKKDMLEELIIDELLKRNAKEKKITEQALMRQIYSQGIDVNDEQVERYYRENRRRMKHWQGSEEKLKEQFRKKLQDQKKEKRVKEYTRPLWYKYNVAVFLKPPLNPVVNVDIDNNYFSGPKNATVTVVEFSDYMCPSCRRTYRIVKEIMKAYQGKIKLVFKDYPLHRHMGAKSMALAARCAGDQEKFWEYQNLLFSKGKPNKEHMIEYAKNLNLDVAKFDSCFESGKYLPDVEKDIEDAHAVGISSTPSFIINGKLYTGSISLQKFKELINNALAN